MRNVPSGTTSSPGCTRKSFELTFISIPSVSRADCGVLSYSWGEDRRASCRTPQPNLGLWPRQCASVLFCAQRFEAGNDVEQFLVDAILAQTMKCPVEVLQRFVDVFVGALHRCQAARVLAGEGFGARPEDRHEKIFADKRPQGRDAVTHDLGQDRKSTRLNSSHLGISYAVFC